MQFVSWNDEFDTIQWDKYLLSIHYASFLSIVIIKTRILLLKSFSTYLIIENAFETVINNNFWQ